MSTFVAGYPLLFAALCGLGAMMVLALGVWLASIAKQDASIVDSVWSALIYLGVAVYALTLPQTGPRTFWVMVLAALWAIRLAAYITWRNWGEPEDRRYVDIRARNQPNYERKSLYLVFEMQAVLAWIVSMTLLGAVAGQSAWTWLDSLGASIMLFGLIFETVGDAQLAAFKGNADNRGRVMDKGLWYYTRHPNYFGEFCVWWGFYLMALSAGGWWAIVSPLLMSVLLLKVSGVTLLEKDITERRPAYRDYIARTNAFFPGLPKKS
jgi:steroid 5-alpha reductase family enzyme